MPFVWTIFDVLYCSSTVVRCGEFMFVDVGIFVSISFQIFTFHLSIMTERNARNDGVKIL